MIMPSKTVDLGLCYLASETFSPHAVLRRSLSVA
jgi:hypothetical protein